MFVLTDVGPPYKYYARMLLLSIILAMTKLDGGSARNICCDIGKP